MVVVVVVMVMGIGGWVIYSLKSPVCEWLVSELYTMLIDGGLVCLRVDAQGPESPSACRTSRGSE